MVQMLHKCNLHMDMKQRGLGVEKRKHAVGAQDTQNCTSLQTKRFRTAAYSVDNANFFKLNGIFRDGADVALMKSAHEHQPLVGAKSTPTVTDLHTPPSPAITHSAVNGNLRKFGSTSTPVQCLHQCKVHMKSKLWRWRD